MCWEVFPVRWFDEYLNKVAQQIRVKRIRQPLLQELEDHMLLQKNAYLDEGLSENEAEKRAIADMGDALLVGGELDRVHRPQTHWNGIILALFFIVLGLLLQWLLGTIDFDLLNCVFAVFGSGIILLVGMTDYTFWQKLTFPALGAWLLLWLWRIYSMSASLASPVNIAIHHFLTMPMIYPVYRVLFMITPECLSVAAPLLTVFLITRLRGGKHGSFALCAAVPLSVMLLALKYQNTGYNDSAMMVMSLIGFAVLLIAICRGFFGINRKGSVILIAALSVFPLYHFIAELVMWFNSDQPYFQQMLELLRASKLIGRGAEVPGITDIVQLAPDLSEELLILIIYRFGWIPFAVLILGMVGVLARCFVRFILMENRMGGLLGLAATLTLSAQVALYCINNFTCYTEYLCLPLVSMGNAMLAIDAVLVGIMLSALRGQNLPEAIRYHTVNPKSA